MSKRLSKLTECQCSSSNFTTNDERLLVDRENTRRRTDSSEEQECFVDRVLKKKRQRFSNEKFNFYIRWHSGSCQWVPQENLHCPILIQQFEERCRRRNVINRYNDANAVVKSVVYGFQRKLPVEKFVGAMLLENIPVLETKWRTLDEHDLVLWEEAKEKCPKKVLEFFLNFLLFHQSTIVNCWGKYPLPKIMNSPE